VTLYISKTIDKRPSRAQPAIARIRFNNMLQTCGISWMAVMENLSSPLYLRMISSACDSGNLWTTGVTDFSVMK